MNPTILAALNSTLIYSLLDDYEDCCVLTEFSKSDLEEINHFSWTGECKNIKVFIALGIDLQAIFFGQNPTVQVSSSFKVEVKDEILDHHMQGIDNIDDINDYNEDIILADVKREKTKKEKVLKKNRNGSPLKELQEPRIKRKYTKRKKSEEDEDDDDWTKAKPTKKKKKEKDPFFVSGTGIFIYQKKVIYNHIFKIISLICQDFEHWGCSNHFLLDFFLLILAFLESSYFKYIFDLY